MLNPATETIAVFRRQEAIAEGALIDVTPTAQEAGVRYPVAVTSKLWHDYITPDDRSRPFGQSEEGRLWDVLYLLFCAIKCSGGPNVRELTYDVSFIMKRRQRRTIRIKSTCGPNDNLTPCITLSLPEEN